MTTTIHSNGSKWAGEAPDSIEVLLTVLQKQPLNRVFERYGSFYEECKLTGMTRFFGNFFTVSHVFRIDSDDATICAALKTAIDQNMKRADYLAQPSPEQVAKAEVEYRERRRQEQIARQRAAALRFLSDTA